MRDDTPERAAGGLKRQRVARPALSMDLQTHIGSRLRALYDEVVSEPIPDRFMELLNQLERAESSQSGHVAPGSSEEEQPA